MRSSRLIQVNELVTPAEPVSDTHVEKNSGLCQLDRATVCSNEIFVPMLGSKSAGVTLKQ